MQVHKLVIPLLLAMAINAAKADSIFYPFKKALIASASNGGSRPFGQTLLRQAGTPTRRCTLAKMK
ncbi:MAG: hypothetical protein JWN23_1240 [Rhodocyclales bacterium]|nr:hypothetical protein [Rhodocyclales bacterium]